MSVVVEPMSTSTASPRASREPGRRRMPVCRRHRPDICARSRGIEPPKAAAIEQDCSGQRRRNALGKTGNALGAPGKYVGKLPGHGDGVQVGFAKLLPGLRKCRIEVLQPLPQRAGDRRRPGDAPRLRAAPP